MTSFNKVFLAGNLTRNPELRYLPTGNPCTAMTIAVNTRRRGFAGKKETETCFVKLLVLNELAKACADQLTKGSPLFVEGVLREEVQEKHGVKRSRLYVLAEKVLF
ncbi:MAG: single-stranded DNA-binding protein [Lentisphaerae bacterium]|nr:single-stranded DNA-binding protein [Lentisphaerota bacterium]